MREKIEIEGVNVPTWEEFEKLRNELAALTKRINDFPRVEFGFVETKNTAQTQVDKNGGWKPVAVDLYVIEKGNIAKINQSDKTFNVVLAEDAFQIFDNRPRPTATFIFWVAFSDRVNQF